MKIRLTYEEAALVKCALLDLLGDKGMSLTDEETADTACIIAEIDRAMVRETSK